MSIRKQFLLIFASVSIMPLIFFGAGSYLYFQNSFKNQVLKDFVLVSKFNEAAIDIFFSLAKGRVIDFSSDGFIRDGAAEIVSGRGGVSAVKNLNSHLINNKIVLDLSIAGISILDLRGKVIASTDEKKIGEDEFNENYFIEALKLPYKNAFTSDFIKENIDGERVVIAASAPLVSKSGANLYGVIVIYYLDQKLRETMLFSSSAGRVFETFKNYLVNKDGYLISAANTHISDKILKEKIETLPVQNCREKNEETAGVYLNSEGREVLGSSFCLLRNNWIAITEVETAEIFKPFTAARNFLIFLTLIELIFVLFIVLIFTYQKVEQINSLMRLTEEFGKGNFDFRVPIKTKSEIGLLGESFNKMAEKLKNLDKLKYNFVKAISHQMRTPLVEMRWSMELLLGGKLGALAERQEQFLKLIYDSNYNIIQIVNDVVLVLSVEEKTFQIKKEASAVENLVETKAQVADELIVVKSEDDTVLPEATVVEVSANAEKAVVTETPLVEEAKTKHAEEDPNCACETCQQK
ncbi:MAG: HAMP domain-containing protein, partial [Patescibacteria group bacterium]